ncbi:preprotein translocase subunit SecG [uncultured Planktomarina sp.]|jgi:preprotein translocase subunit SecG|uniref:preprotein translocase subunit SecG n=1 Tax=uncultured Planktomarina sp. TaxID=1538529 RepID=UPI003261272D|tara:strand:- start:29603 stop:29956 length:354 start_codon:yes stop_codon:yes gene_type:complete
MQNVVLIIHLLLAVTLIGLVLLQRSEGGGLGMGGGGGGGGAMSGRAAASAITKLTWILSIAFICTSLGLTILQVQKSSGSSVLDQLMPVTEQSSTQSADDLLPPSAADSAPLLPIAE